MNKYSNEDSSNLDLRFLIPSKAAGIVIGKGGENVKDIREKFSLKVNIPDSSGPERILLLSGRTQSVYDALEVILEKIRDCIPGSEAEYYSNNGRVRRRYRSRGDEANGTANGCEGDGEVDLRMLIHQSLAGGIIGRGGEKIRELREQVNLRTLNLYQTVCPNSTDRVTQMVGDLTNVLTCVKNIMNLLHSQFSQIRGSDQPYDARNFDESQALRYGGWLSKQAFKTLVEYGPDAFNSTSSSYGQSGVETAPMNGGATRRLSSRQHQSDGGGSGGAGCRHSVPNSGNSNGNSHIECLPGVRRDNLHIMDDSCLDRTVKTVQVSVPNSYMGAIMGRGGMRIRSIRDESGADIRVYEPDKNGGDRIIDITGTQHHITYAQHLLKSCVLAYHDKR